ncbi:hypothetical protein O181_035197 [Austropuccinia psidii MF-1]|uniref:DUF4939 domain-containing protein n=1 Tax=Austropuccinia psidii MF-1 TaxID=1389203 RepID=A0A9Q3D859_9BASI|nr:hypothetical protein [Austropuccinia psidii MF-1]
MPIKQSPPARQTRSQARAQAVLTPTPRVPLERTPAVPQLRTPFGRSSTIQEGRKRAKKIKFIFRSNGEEEEENSVEEEYYDGTEGVPAPVGALQGTGGPTISQSNQPVSHYSEPSLLAIMKQMTQIMPNLQESSFSEAQRPPDLRTPSMKVPECFDETQSFKVRSFIQSSQFIFHNDLEAFSQDVKKAPYATSFLIGKAAKWIEPYLSNLTNQNPNYLLHSWNLFESKLFTFLGDTNEVRKAEAELDSLIMKEGGHL